MSTTDIFLWIVIPYVAITIFIVGHIWRYRRDQFGWTSRSNQLLERRLLKWAARCFTTARWQRSAATSSGS